MKTTSTLLKVSLVALFLFLAHLSSAATYYTCIGTNLNLNATTAPAGITYTWDVRQGATSISGYPASTAPTSFPTAGTYVVVLTATSDAASGSCPSDPVENTIIVLPPLGLTLGNPSAAAYCAANGTVNSSNIAATTTGQYTDAITANDLAISYSYSVTKDGGTAVDGATVGTIAADGTFTLNTTDAGIYIITGSVKYVQGTVTTNALLGNGCPVNATGSKTVTVTAKPAQPTVTITAAP
ncbi:PKD domain-containing protein [Pedobacter sp. JY14-1]|uniref:PKD domain-containing protein n=1 Tax=Pedobacter sp. JY14-1 TaxID=3034151 RepID=UPI0023E0EAC0|nr:PKD domain-containing protein [Pedobacter sp. JY14-1]